MEPGEQNAYLFAFFLTMLLQSRLKTDKNRLSCTKSMEQCLKNVVFFSPKNVLNEVSTISS